MLSPNFQAFKVPRSHRLYGRQTAVLKNMTVHGKDVLKKRECYRRLPRLEDTRYAASGNMNEKFHNFLGTLEFDVAILVGLWT